MGWQSRRQHVSKQLCTPNKFTERPKAPNLRLPLRLTLFLTNAQPPSQILGLGGGGLRGGVKLPRHDFIAENAPSMPWKRIPPGTFLSFCPTVTQNPTLVQSVYVLPCLPCAARV